MLKQRIKEVKHRLRKQPFFLRSTAPEAVALL
jgi:hypothetical protein